MAPAPRLVLEKSPEPEGLAALPVVPAPLLGVLLFSTDPNRLVFGCESAGACDVSGFFGLPKRFDVAVFAAGVVELLAALLPAFPKRPKVAVVVAGVAELLVALLLPALPKRPRPPPAVLLAGCC